MDAKVPGRRATKLAKLVADVAWWLSVFALTAGAIIAVVAPLSGGRYGFGQWVEVRVRVPDAALRGALPLASPDTVAAAGPALKEVRATLEFRTGKWWLRLADEALQLPWLALLMVGAYVVRRLLRDVLAGRVFTAENARRLSLLGWVMIGAGLALPLLDFGRRWMLWQLTRVEGVRFTEVIEGGGTLWAGVLVLVLAGVWRYGVELQGERDLTV